MRQLRRSATVRFLLPVSMFVLTGALYLGPTAGPLTVAERQSITLEANPRADRLAADEAASSSALMDAFELRTPSAVGLWYQPLRQLVAKWQGRALGLPGGVDARPWRWPAVFALAVLGWFLAWWLGRSCHPAVAWSIAFCIIAHPTMLAIVGHVQHRYGLMSLAAVLGVALCHRRAMARGRWTFALMALCLLFVVVALGLHPLGLLAVAVAAVQAIWPPQPPGYLMHGVEMSDPAVACRRSRWLVMLPVGVTLAIWAAGFVMSQPADRTLATSWHQMPGHAAILSEATWTQRLLVGPWLLGTLVQKAAWPVPCQVMWPMQWHDPPMVPIGVGAAIAMVILIWIWRVKRKQPLAVVGACLVFAALALPLAGIIIAPQQIITNQTVDPIWILPVMIGLGAIVGVMLDRLTHGSPRLHAMIVMPALAMTVAFVMAIVLLGHPVLHSPMNRARVNLDCQPNEPRALMHFASQLALAQRHQDAMWYVDRAVQTFGSVRPGDPAMTAMVRFDAKNAEAAGQGDRAIRAYNRLLQLDRHDLEANLALASHALDQGDRVRAGQLLRGLASRHPEHRQVMYLQAQLAEASERWTDAVASYEALLLEHPHFQQAREDYMRLLRRLNR